MLHWTFSVHWYYIVYTVHKSHMYDFCYQKKVLTSNCSDKKRVISKCYTWHLVYTGSILCTLYTSLIFMTFATRKNSDFKFLWLNKRTVNMLHWTFSVHWSYIYCVHCTQVSYLWLLLPERSSGFKLLCLNKRTINMLHWTLSVHWSYVLCTNCTQVSHLWLQLICFSNLHLQKKMT